MPTKKKTSTKSSSKTKKRSTAKKKPVAKSTVKKSTAKKPNTVMKMDTPPEVKQPVSSGVCRACNAFPVGSVELVTLLLVLVFSLSAVLMTSIYAMGIQTDTIQELETSLQR